MKAKTATKTIEQSPDKPYHKGIEITDIIAYKKKGLTHTEIAKLLGCDQSNISYRIKNADIEGLENFRDFKDTAFEQLQRTISKNITPEDIKKASLQQKVISMSVLQDKIQVIRGLASDIQQINVITATLTEATERMQKAGLIVPSELSTDS